MGTGVSLLIADCRWMLCRATSKLLPEVHEAVCKSDTVRRHCHAGLVLLQVWLNSEVSLHPNNVASTELLDRKTPNAEICAANGYSSMVFDQRLFVSFNP